MFTNTKLCILFCIGIIFTGCISENKKTALKFEPVSSKVYMPDSNYNKDLGEWKKYYEQCTKKDLFPDAYYLQLQDKIYIGSINNEQAIDINKGTNILDTSNGNSPFNIMSVINSSNCTDTIQLSDKLKTAFFKEVVDALNTSPEFKSLESVIDAGDMTIITGSLYSTALIKDSLINILNSTRDSSLIIYKELLLKPENVLLAETIEVMGFRAEFSLKAKLSDFLRKQLVREVFPDNKTSKVFRSLVLLSSNRLRIVIDKRFTVLGRFLQLKVDEKTD